MTRKRLSAITVGVTVGIALVSAAGLTSAAPSPVEQAKPYNDVSTKAAAELRSGFGCLARPSGQLVLLVTSSKYVARAKRIIRKVKAQKLVTVGVIKRKYSDASLTKLQQKINTWVGLRNPDVVAFNTPLDTGVKSCGRVDVLLSSEAAPWIRPVLDDLQHGAGTDRMTITVVPPNQVPPILIGG
jgi:hypothetical protein